MKYFKPLFFVVFVFLVGTASITLKNSFVLETEYAPNGILSFQMAKTDVAQFRILKEWDSVSIIRFDYASEMKDSLKNNLENLSAQAHTGDESPLKVIKAISIAKSQTKADFFFIFCYVLFGCMLLYRSYPKMNDFFKNIGWKLPALLLVVAGCSDFIENFLTLHTLDKFSATTSTALLIFLLAGLKFLLIIVVAIYFLISGSPVWKQAFIDLSSMLKEIVNVTWKFRIVVIVLLVMLAFLSLFDQGQDLLVTINSSTEGIVLFYVVVTVMAALNWYLPKLYAQPAKIALRLFFTRKLPFSTMKQSQIDYARFLGTITFIVPAVGLLITLNAYHVDYFLKDIPPFAILLLMIILYINVIKHTYLDRIYVVAGVFNKRRYWFTMIFIVSCLILFGVNTDKNMKSIFLFYLSICYCLLSFAFLLTVTYRSKIGVFAHVRVGTVVLSSGLVTSILFLLFNFSDILFYFTNFSRFLSLPLVIAGLITYILFFSFLLVLGKRFRIQIITLLLMATFAISATKINDFHRAETVAANTSKADSLNQYAKEWIESRRKEIIKFSEQYPDKDYPICFVNAHGGGIKAAAWTALVIGKLDTLLRTNGVSVLPNKQFQHYIFSYSGASGGTVGSSLLTAARITSLRGGSDTLFWSPRKIINLFKQDYLTPNLVGMFGRDAWMSCLGKDWYVDRSRLQEISFERYFRSKGIKYAIRLDSGWRDKKREVPLLFSNTFDINEGLKGIVAPVLLDSADFPGALMIQDILRNQKQDLRLSTAAFLSARFPYVCPTGKFDEEHHFTDGGTLENSGAETSMQVLNVFQRELEKQFGKDKKLAKAKKNIKIFIISIASSIDNGEKGLEVKNMYEITAPAIGIYQTSNGNSEKAERISQYLARKNSWKYYAIHPQLAKLNGGWPILPLGWQISNDALWVMRNSLNLERNLELKNLANDIFGHTIIR